MCFTVNVNIIKEELEKRYGSQLIDHEEYTPSYYYHAFAYPDLPVVYLNQSGEREIRPLKWGLIPEWVSLSEEAERVRSMTHNARSETINEKPSFADSFENRRCLVPVAGFFEWQHLASGKRPWYIYCPNYPVVSLAGIFDRWYDPDSNTDILSFSIITTRANHLMSKIHNSKKRMPVLIPPESEIRWLTDRITNLKELMEPVPEDMLKAHMVSPVLGKTQTNKNRPEIILPYNYPEEQTLF